MNRTAAIVTGVFLIRGFAFGQTAGGSTPSSGATPAPGPVPASAASASTVPIESQMIAYEAVKELAHEIGMDITSPAHARICEDKYFKLREAAYFEEDDKRTKNSQAYDDFASKAKAEIARKCAPSEVILLGSTINMQAVAAYRSYEALANELGLQYAHARPSEPINNNGAASTDSVAAISTVISTIAGTINTLKSQTTQAGATFTPVEQVLYSDLESVISGVNKLLVIQPYPTDLKAGNGKIAKLYGNVASKREEAIRVWRDDFKSRTPKPKEEEVRKYNPLDSELKGLESEFIAFQTFVSSSGFPTIAYGASLVAALGDRPFDVLTVGTAAAGGGDRANTYFLVNVFFPAPHHSYNGGAEVAYTLRNEDGLYKKGDALRLVYGYTKWRPPSLHRKDELGFANFKWDKKGRNGGSIHWWRY